jgi:hypothetical protein
MAIPGTVRDLTLVFNNAGIALPAQTVTGNLSVTAGGAITGPGALSVSGTTDLTAGSTNNITLANATNNFTGGVRVVSGNNVSLADADGIVLGNANGDSTISGTLTVSNAGTITQAGKLLVTGTSDLTAGAGNNITLANAANNFTGGVRVVSGNNVSLADADGIVLGNANGDSTISGTLTVSNAGTITQAGKLLVTGTSDLTAGANAIILDDALNNFTGAVSLSNSGANNVSLRDTNALVLGTVGVGSGTLDVQAGGALTHARGRSGDLHNNCDQCSNRHLAGIAGQQHLGNSSLGRYSSEHS